MKGATNSTSCGGETRWYQFPGSFSYAGKPALSENQTAACPEWLARVRAQALKDLERATGQAAKDLGHITTATRKRALSVLESIAKFDAEKFGEAYSPNVGVGDDDTLVLEWWATTGRKITLYVGEDEVEFIKVWGRNPVTEMSEGALKDIPLDSLWRWLRSP